MAVIQSRVSNKLISGTNGNDDILNWVGGSSVTINTGEGNDSVRNYSSSVTIDTGKGDDYVYNLADSVIINAGEGNDYVHNDSGSLVTINGGKGNDTILNNCYFRNDGSIYYWDNDASNVLFEYTEGDGNDIIYGFYSDSTLSISGGSYSSVQSGEDIIFTVGDGKISLIGAANLDFINVDFNRTVEENSWKLSGTTATYGTSTNTLITLSGVKSLNGISLSGNVITVAKSSLGTSKVTLSGSGYTLALANDVSKPSNKKSWSLSGNTATYKQTTSAGYKLASDSKSISYSKAATSTLTTITGVKSTNGLKISGKVVTVAASALNKAKVTINNGYTLALASDVPTQTVKKAAWTYKNSVATYKSAATTAGYNLASNSKTITYSKAKSASTLAKITGAKSKNGFKVSGKTIKLATNSLSKKVSVSGSYAFEFAADYKNALITGSASNDTIKALGTNTTINGGKGNDSLIGGTGKDIFVYSNGDGNDIITNFDENDRISIKSGAAKVSTSGNDVIFTVGSGKITVKGGNGKNITYFDASGNENTYPNKSDDVEYSANGKSATLKDTYDKDSFEATSTLVTINAAAVEQPLKITGNNKANKITGTKEDDTIYGGVGGDTIVGGAGNDELYGEKGNDLLIGGAGSDSLWGGTGDDTLTGGKGRDIFYYDGDDGNDTITDYSPGVDTVMILSVVAIGNPISNNSGDVTFKIGTGQITFQNSVNKYIELVDKVGNVLKKYDPN